MPRTIKSRLHPNKHKPKTKQEVNITKSSLPPNLQSFKHISNLFYMNELRRFSIIR